MFNTQLDAIVPMLCVTLAALASMGAEAFRGRASGCRSAALGIIGLVGAAVSAAAALEPQRREASASSSPTTSACS